MSDQGSISADRANKSDASAYGPASPWLCAGLLLAGMGTVLLGPILPTLSQEWHLPDHQKGLLIFAKFLGAFVGGSTIPKRLRLGIFMGLLLTAVGLLGFAFAEGLGTGSIALFAIGVGLGQIIASTDILVGRRYQNHTGSALSIINFFWSVGAVAVGLVVAWALPHYSLPQLLIAFAAAFVLIAVGGLIQQREGSVDLAPKIPQGAIPRHTMIAFGALLFLYGGLETSLSQWVTTYTDRYSGGHVLGGQSALVLLWLSIAVGRVVTSLLLRHVSERVVQRLCIVVCLATIPVLATAESGLTIAVSSIALGCGLAPFFPSTFAQLLRRRPPARVAAFILAVSGLGAAGLSWLMGIVSSHANSLRVAMAVPFGTAAALLVVSFLLPSPEQKMAAVRKLEPDFGSRR